MVRKREGRNGRKKGNRGETRIGHENRQFLELSLQDWCNGLDLHRENLRKPQLLSNFAEKQRPIMKVKYTFWIG